MRERVEEYLGAIYRLRGEPEEPVPLSQLGEYFGFSPVSIHEMVRKLVERACVAYHPYHGVTLTEEGERVACALIRRHRLWERFLTDMLEIPWDKAHAIAGRLEHAAPGEVTDRLAHMLGDPDRCPHGAPIPPGSASPTDCRLHELPDDSEGCVSQISPETPELLARVQAWGLLPGTHVSLVAQQAAASKVQVGGRDLIIPIESARAIWVVKLA